LGATLNFARLCQTRPGYGYWGIADPHASEPHRDDDGVYVADLRNRSLRLIVSHRDVRRVGKILPAADEKDWFNHLKFNPSATRLVFLHRWDGMVAGHVGRMHRVMTVNPDGSDLQCLLEGYVASHFDWYDDERILIWLSHAGGTGFFLVDETTGAMQAVGPDFLTLDGHCNFRPQRDWFLTDTYPQGEGRLQFLMLVHPGSNRVVEVAALPSMPVADASLRCDLHARWNHDGTRICLDSTHERSRQMYILDVSDVVTS